MDKRTSWTRVLLGAIGLVIITVGAVVMGAGYLVIKLGAMPFPMKPKSDFDWIDRKDGSVWKGRKPSKRYLTR